MSGARLALTLCVTKAREGSEADMDALEHMFRHLGFESTMKTDPTAQVLSIQLQVRREGLDQKDRLWDTYLILFHPLPPSNSWTS